MSDIIKRGRMEVKKRNLFGSAYKNRCVVLRNSLALNCKTVEILEVEEEADENRDIIKLNDVWCVQDKPSKNKGRYTFELVKGDEVILTFACSSVMERKEWTESFRILNQLALPCDTSQQPNKPLSDYFQVTLLKNRSAIEINQSGLYLLSVTDSDVVLHWNTGAIVHHWPKRTVIKFLHHPKKKGHLILHAKRSGTDDVIEFEFTTTPENSMEILKMWNMRLLESISYNTQQLNEISSSVPHTSNVPLKDKKEKASKSKSFRSTKNNTITKREPDLLRRADSLNKLHNYRTDINGPGGGGGGASQGLVRIGGLPPLPREASAKSWCGPEDLSGLGGVGNLSQDSFFGLVVGDAPPLPPRPSNRIKKYTSDEEDPDYSYIKEDEVKGPNKEGSGLNKEGSGHTRSNSSSVDDVLNELEQEIMRDNKKKRAHTLNRAHSKPSSAHGNQLASRVSPGGAGLPQDSNDVTTRQPPLRLGPRVASYHKPDPQDYTYFVPSKHTNTQSTSSEPEKPVGGASHIRSISEPDPHPYPYHHASNMISQPPVFETNEISDTPPYARNQSQPTDAAPSDYAMIGEESSAPILPPRSWRYTSTSSSHDSNGVGAGHNGNPFGGSAASSGSNLDVFGSEKGGAALSGESVSPVLDSRGVNESKDTVNPHHRNSEVLSSLEEGFSTKGRGFDIGGTPPSPPSSASNNNKESQVASPTSSSSFPYSRQSLNSTPQNVSVTTPPPLPPRSPTKDKVSRRSSSSSSSSGNSSGRCPRCKSIRKTNNSKTSVGKTVSLDHRGVISGKGSSEEYRKSLPDLADTNSVPENSLGKEGGGEGEGGQRQHRPAHRNHGHCSKCSPESSNDGIHGNNSSRPSLHSESFEYLQLVGEKKKNLPGPAPSSSGPAPLDSDLTPELDLLTSCLETLDSLKNKASSSGLPGETATMTSMVSNSSHSTDQFGSKVKSIANDPYAQAKRETAMALAELNQPLSQLGPPFTQSLGPSLTQPFTQSVSESLTQSLTQPLGHSLTQPMSQSFTQPTGQSLSQSPHTLTHGKHPSKPLGKTFSYSPETKKLYNYNGHTPPPPSSSFSSSSSYMTKHNSLSSISASHLPSSSFRGTLKAGPGGETPPHWTSNTMLKTKSSSTLIPAAPPTLTSAPPTIPPRSVVSLSPNQQPQNQTTPTYRSPTYRSNTISGHTHPPTLRSSSAIGMHSGMNRHPRGNPMEDQGQSSTVFIHHIKDRRVGGLTHLV